MYVEKLFPTRVGVKMSFVLGREERGLVMVEPPGQAVVRAVFEIDDRVLVTVELLAVERVSGPMHRWGIADLGSGTDLRGIELCKDRGRRDAVETIAVIQYA